MFYAAFLMLLSCQDRAHRCQPGRQPGRGRSESNTRGMTAENDRNESRPDEKATPRPRGLMRKRLATLAHATIYS
jgi:hypothetical protein